MAHGQFGAFSINSRFSIEDLEGEPRKSRFAQKFWDWLARKLPSR